jgi:hypothetical protein
MCMNTHAPVPCTTVPCAPVPCRLLFCRWHHTSPCTTLALLAPIAVILLRCTDLSIPYMQLAMPLPVTSRHLADSLRSKKNWSMLQSHHMPWCASKGGFEECSAAPDSALSPRDRSAFLRRIGQPLEVWSFDWMSVALLQRANIIRELRETLLLEHLCQPSHPYIQMRRCEKSSWMKRLFVMFSRIPCLHFRIPKHV